MKISENPSFVSEKAVKKYFELLQKSSFYVEYGSGGSTVAAAKLGKNFASYESSEKFLKLFQNILLQNTKARHKVTKIHLI